MDPSRYITVSGNVSLNASWLAGPYKSVNSKIKIVPSVGERGGVFMVSFGGLFQNPPAVVVSQVWGGTGPPGNTRDNAVVMDITPDWFTVATGDDNGVTIPRNFSFIASGYMSKDA
ncbi:hypothetical protein BC936DRAFT_147464 [Jimgerdemannia flammicorona]|uniref:Uncharacterized protein n=1 Tax=Jimgerdemannia flammicorona TaxID=994334 RepID=A0A433D5A6_9FUNG|nr:hypothetical protein BC936DRAFT_147464 [Jimgerdemannia flammicorona]